MTSAAPPTLRTTQIIAGAIASGLIFPVPILLFLVPPLEAGATLLDPRLAMGLMALPLVMVLSGPPLIRRAMGPSRAVSPEDWAGRYQREVIVTATLLEGSGWAFLVLGYLGGVLIPGLGGVALCLLLLAAYFPTEDRARARVEGVAAQPN